jgi:transcriptional regulator with XRE-family HTH domain
MNETVLRTMTASLDAVNRLRERRAALGVSSAFLARLGGVSATAMSDYLRGLRRLGNEVELRLLNITHDMALYIEASKPFHFPLDDADATERLIEHFKANGITAEQLQQEISRLVGR